MANESTDVFWDVDGVAVQTYAYNVQSLSPKWSVPVLRGEDTKVAYRKGAMWRPKIVDVRTLTLGMWVSGMGTDGKPTALGMERQFNQNIQMLRSLFFKFGQRQITLTKRWKDPITGTVIAASTMAELTSDFAVEMHGPHHCAMTIDLLLSDPYFYAPVENVSIPVSGTPTVIDNPGDAPTTAIMLTAHGILDNPTLTNSSPDPDIWVKIGSSIGSGDQVFLDVEGFGAIRDSDDANIVGSVTRSGSRNWMELFPGPNSMVLTASSGAGAMDVAYQPAYL